MFPMSPKPSPSIEKPTPFAKWIQTKALFTVGTPLTETHVTDGHEDGIRYAYGKCQEGWCFYISMTHAEELIFWQVYHEWRKTNPTEDQHVAIVNNKKPPNCGTPNTPKCPDEAMANGGLRTLSPTTGNGVKAA